MHCPGGDIGRHSVHCGPRSSPIPLAMVWAISVAVIREGDRAGVVTVDKRILPVPPTGKGSPLRLLTSGNSQ